MKWVNSIIYVGIICVAVGVLMGVFAETQRFQAIGGLTASLGALIFILGWLTYQKEPLKKE